MKRLIAILLCVFSLCHFVACKKKKSSAPAAVPALVFPASSDVPYDTSNTDGIFSANILFDSSKGNRGCSIYFTAWFTKNITQGFVDSVVINANGRTLTPPAAHAHYLMTKVAQFVPNASFVPDTPVAWIMTGNPGYTFSYDNTGHFPSYKINLPDTITKDRNNSFTFNTGTLLNADTVLLKILVPVTKDSTTVFKYYAGPNGGNITLDAALISTIANKDIGVVVNVFNHSVLTLNGLNYLFIKEYTFGRNVWFK